MTGPSGGSSRLRIGGFALMGVGVVAGLVGFATAGSGEQTVVAEPAAVTSQAVAAPAVEPTPTAAATAAVPTGATPTVSPAASAAPSAAASAAPGAAATPAPNAAGAPARSGSGDSRPAPRPALRVLNNSTITGLAARGSQDFQAAGWTVNEVGNFPTRNLPTSTVFYGRGAGEQEAAARLAGEFGLKSQPAATDLPSGPPGLVVILTNDYRGG